MTPQEFSSEFDILYNNIMSNKAPGLDDYEKSFFLTQAQEILVLTYYNGNNSSKDSFEKTEEVRRYLDALVTKETPKAENSEESKEKDGFYHFYATFSCYTDDSSYIVTTTPTLLYDEEHPVIWPGVLHRMLF